MRSPSRVLLEKAQNEANCAPHLTHCHSRDKILSALVFADKTKPSMRGPVSSEAVQILRRGFPHIPFAVGFGRSGPSQTCPRTIQACTPRHIL